MVGFFFSVIPKVLCKHAHFLKILYLFVAVLDLRCCEGFSPVAVSRVEKEMATYSSILA